jgi:hypothetical protein
MFPPNLAALIGAASEANTKMGGRGCYTQMQHPRFGLLKFEVERSGRFGASENLLAVRLAFAVTEQAISQTRRDIAP